MNLIRYKAFAKGCSENGILETYYSEADEIEFQLRSEVFPFAEHVRYTYDLYEVVDLVKLPQCSNGVDWGRERNLYFENEDFLLFKGGGYTAWSGIGQSSYARTYLNLLSKNEWGTGGNLFTFSPKKKCTTALLKEIVKAEVDSVVGFELSKYVNTKKTIKEK